METIPFFTGNYHFPKIENLGMKNKISQNKKRESLSFIKSHFDMISQREIARRLNIGRTTVNTWAKEIGLRFKKHTVNENFFDEFNENSAYILGFIFADGNVAWNPQKGYYSMTITASEKDKDHLEKIRKLLQSTKPLLYSPKTKSYRLIVNSKILCKKLMELGVIPRKTLVVEFPQIPEEHLKHFLRGVIDGDGNVRYLNRNVSPYFEITVSSGSLKFCQGFVKSVKSMIGVEANIRKVKGNTHIIQYSCSRGKKLAKYIYSDADIFLERKYLPYKNNILEVQKNEEG